MTRSKLVSAFNYVDVQCQPTWCGGIGWWIGYTSSTLTSDIPKLLLPISGKPFADHLLVNLRKNGIDKVVLCVGHMGDQIASYVGDGSQHGLSVEYSYDGEVLVGTGGAIKRLRFYSKDRFS